ncbi:MAG TPA: NAD(P)/FAD-dependent oxidoreductase [Polyangiaceae bacterium]|jgi:phytoene dehydrogenase-like protein|nr:NAD(P)/FAD-dependent oxidoreductase [Polyangiaceae bacterium]
MNTIIVIGAGHNGLTAAASLAKGGEKVVVLEARDSIGGLAARIPLGDGYAVPGILHDSACVREAIVDHLGLERFGLKRRSEPLRICAPSEQGDPLFLVNGTVEGVSQPDVVALAKLRAFMARVAAPIRSILDREPPEPTSELWPMVKAGFGVRRLGTGDMLELLRVAPMCVADWMRDNFVSERLSAALALPAMEGAFVGPWSPGTAALLLLREAVAGAEIDGGPAALVDALGKAAASYGVEVRTRAAVARIELKNGAVEGVVLEDGETIPCTRVLATCDPKQTLLRLIGPQRLPVRLADDIQLLRTRGTTAKLHLALSGQLELADGTAVEALRTGETLDDLERAFDPAKYRELPERPALEARVPSLRDTSLVPQGGHHVVSVMVHHASADLDWTKETRARLTERVIDELARYCPTLRERIVASELIAPPDLAERYRLTGGHIHHGEHGLDQLLFMRPTVDCAKYATPVNGLFFGGSGSHPGGGLTCAPGALAARALLV